jgi:hypothetical protein
MMPILLAALGGAGGLGAILTPVLMHLTARRIAVQTENSTLIDQLQEERDAVLRRAEASEQTVAALWDYTLGMRYWMVKGQQGQPPTLPSSMSIAAVRYRLEAAS